MSTVNKTSARRRTENKAKRTVWGTWSPTQPQFTRASSLRLYNPRWGPDSCHSANRRAKVVGCQACQVVRARRLIWIYRCGSRGYRLKAPCHPRATLRGDWGSRRNPGRRRKEGYAASVIRGSAVRVTSDDTRTRRTGGRSTRAHSATLFVAAEMRCRGTLGISTGDDRLRWSVQSH